MSSSGSLHMIYILYKNFLVLIWCFCSCGWLFCTGIGTQAPSGVTEPNPNWGKCTAPRKHNTAFVLQSHNTKVGLVLFVWEPETGQRGICGSQTCYTWVGLGRAGEASILYHKLLNSLTGLVGKSQQCFEGLLPNGHSFNSLRIPKTQQYCLGVFP